VFSPKELASPGYSPLRFACLVSVAPQVLQKKEASLMSFTMMKTDHFAFEVSDMDKAIRFYTKKLGLKLLSREFDRENQEAYAFLKLDHGSLELLQKFDKNGRPVKFRKRTPKAPYCPHLALKTPDMKQLIAKVKKEDIPIAKGPLKAPGLAKWIYICDPDNNIIEFVQWL